MAGGMTFEERLTRFLYTNTTTNLFQTGENYTFSAAPIEELLGTEDRVHVVLQHLHHAHHSGLANRDILMAVLAVLLKKATTTIARTTIYYKWEELTRDPENFFLFFDYHTRLKGGWGAGLRRQLTVWYEKQDPLNLLVAVSKITGRGIWSHADIVKHSKIHPANTEIAVILTYCIRGLAQTKAKYEGQPDAQMVLGYLEQLHFIKNCIRPEEAVHVLNEQSFGPDQINGKLLHHSQIWLALLPKMTIREIFIYLKMLTRKKLLATDSVHFRLIKAKFTDRVQIASSGVQPAEVAQLVANVKAGWAHPPTDNPSQIKPHFKKLEAGVTPGLVVSLEILLQHSFANVRQMKKEVTVIVDTTAPGMRNGCWRSYHVSMFQASAVTILTLLAGGCKVKVLVPSGVTTFKQVEILANETPKDVVNKLQANISPLPYFSLKGVNKDFKKTEVLLVLCQNKLLYSPGNSEALFKELERLRRLKDDFKFVFMQLCEKHERRIRDATFVRDEAPWMEELVGWNPDTLRVLEAFITGLF